MNTNIESNHQPITLSPVADENIFDFLPAMFGNYFISGEQTIYSTMRSFCSAYQGGQWIYYNLSNGGRLMALNSADKFDVLVLGNQFDAEMSSQAVSIVVNLAVLSQFGEALYGTNEDLSEHMYTQHRLLMDFAREHPESEKIMRAID
ncbi:antirestriction protein [Comamonas thiooxydans]|nr:antirestriction protein [Comamonas thiooxydans]